MGLIILFMARCRDWFLGGGRQEIERLAELWHERLSGEGAPTVPVRGRAGFDRLMDALNRLPRPLMALGSLVVLATAAISPDWFAARMEALAAMPEPLWWLIGAVISLFFGARFQNTAQALRREIVAGIVAGPVLPSPDAASPLMAATGGDADLTLEAEQAGGNPALSEWQGTQP